MMPGVQTELTAGYGEQVRERRDRVDALRERARTLRARWARAFGPGETPVAVDRAWAGLNAALERVQDEDADAHIEAAAEYLDAAASMLADVEAEAGGGAGDGD